MKVTPIKTHKITEKSKNLFAILDKYVPSMKEGSVLAITSKIIAICQGRIIKDEGQSKDELVEKEADLFLLASENKYGVSISIKDNLMVASAGIDKSNGNGYFILWPENSQQVANKVREYLSKRFKLKKVGVIITDSKGTPMRWGVVGAGLAHSGFSALNNYIGTPDIFGEILHVTRVNVVDGLSAAAVLEMGEGKEQTPLAIIEDLPYVQFQDRNPTADELKNISISLDEDIYGPILKRAPWKKGGQFKSHEK